MWTAQQLSEFLALRIGHILTTPMGPMMFGGSAQGVDTLLHSYLEVWSRLHERYEDYETLRCQRLSALNAGTANFAFHYRRRHKSQSEFHAANYVALQYKKIVKQLQLPVPWDQIKAERQRVLRSHVRKSR